MCATSLAVGARPIALTTVWHAVFAYDRHHVLEAVVRELRGPRTLIGLIAGPAFAVAGALMQAVTRNPLADPGILGINAGAGLAVAAATAFAGATSPNGFVWFAFAGAAGAAVVGYGLGSVGPGGPTPIKLTIAGAIVASLIGSATALLIAEKPDLAEAYAFWVAGSIAGRPYSVFVTITPFIVVGLIISFALSRALNVLSLGDQTARALGQRIVLVRATSAATVVLLAGAAVAGAGPIAFVGLVVPNAVRLITGPDYRWIVPFSAVGGAIFLLAADIVGRVIAAPSEIEASVVAGLVGGPIFVLIARRRRLSML
jgi:iron complex transport system permease protein